MDLHMTRRMERIKGSTREEEAKSSTKKCKGPKNKNPRAMLKSNQKRHPASLSLMASITFLLLANFLILPSCKLSGSCFFSFFCGVRVWVCFGLPPFLFRAHCNLDARLDPFFHPDEQKRPTLPQWRARHWSTNRRWESKKRPTETRFAIVRQILHRIFFHLVLDQCQMIFLQGIQRRLSQRFLNNGKLQGPKSRSFNRVKTDHAQEVCARNHENGSKWPFYYSCLPEIRRPSLGRWRTGPETFQLKQTSKRSVCKHEDRQSSTAAMTVSDLPELK